MVSTPEEVLARADRLAGAIAIQTVSYAPGEEEEEEGCGVPCR